MNDLIPAKKPDLMLINKKKELVIEWILLFRQIIKWK